MSLSTGPAPPTLTPTNTPTLTPNTPTPTPQAGNNCTYTQGYWKNHAEEWPVTSLQLGDTTYSQGELLDILNPPPRGDATYTLAYQQYFGQFYFGSQTVSLGSSPRSYIQPLFMFR